MKEYLTQAKNKVQSAYIACKEKITATALAAKDKLPNPIQQSFDMIYRPFSESTWKYFGESPNAQNALKITITANIAFASLKMIYLSNSYLLTQEVRDGEFTIERHIRYVAVVTNNLLWLFVLRKSIRMMLENPLNLSIVYKGVVLDHPNDHHQLDCRNEHLDLAAITYEQVSLFFAPIYYVQNKWKEAQLKIANVRYMMRTISGALASGIYYTIDIELVRISTAYLPYGNLVAFILNAIVTGHSLPEYNYANQCTDHKHKNIKKLNVSSLTLGFFIATVAEIAALFVGGDSTIKSIIINTLYAAAIPVVMSAPLKPAQKGRDYFYANRSIAAGVMEIAANRIVRAVKEPGYTLELHFETPPKVIEPNKIYLYFEKQSPTKQKNKKESKEYEYLVLIIKNKEGVDNRYLITQEKLGERYATIKEVLQSKNKDKEEKSSNDEQNEGKPQQLSKEDEDAIYEITNELGYSKSLALRVNDLNQKWYIKTVKHLVLSDDFLELDLFVRRPDVKRYLDLNESTYQLVLDVIMWIQSSMLAKAGNMLPDMMVPENLMKIKKVLELILLEKSDSVVFGLESFLNARHEHLNELEAKTVYKVIHQPLQLAQVSDQSKVERSPDPEVKVKQLTTITEDSKREKDEKTEQTKQTEQTEQLDLSKITIVDDYEDKELVKRNSMTVEDEEELFAPLKPKVTLHVDSLASVLNARLTDFSVFPPKEKNSNPSIKPTEQTVSQRQVLQ